MRFVGRMLLLVGLPVVGLVGFAAYLTVYFSEAADKASARVTHTYDVIDTLRMVLSGVQDAETGQRGFIITLDPTYLDPYNQALASIGRQLDRLAPLIADNPAQQERWRSITQRVDERLAVLKSILEPATRGDREQARQLLLASGGKALMDGIRGEIAAMIAEEQRLLEERRQASRQSDQITLYVALGGSLIALAALVIGTLLLLVANWRLQRAEARLGRQSALLQGTLDNIRHGIAFFDGKGRLAAFNGAFFSMLDFPRELARTKTPIESFAKVETARGTALLADRAGGQASATPPSAVRFGASDLEIHRTPAEDGGFIVTCVDITQRVHAETMFRQTQKMESIGQLTGGVAHDFNNLLQIVSSNVDLVLASPVDDPRNPQRLRAALAGAERGARLTRQLLAFARRQPLEPRPINPGRLAGDMTDLIRRSLGETIEVETIVAGGLWNAMADPGQLENAILNLAINARDAMPDGGKLTIEVANAFLEEAYAAEHAEVRAGQYVMLAVSDTGTGMAPDVAAKAFEPFFSTKPEGQGTGLGLSQVYGYVKQLGGHVKIYSEPGHGTTVKLYIPRTRQAEETQEVASLTPIEAGQETVLVVEDDAAVRAGAIDMLTELGYRVLQAPNAESAIAILSSGAPIDVLFTDVVMPGPIKTRDLVRQAQSRLPQLAVLYTSGYTENAIIHDGRLDADVLLLSKPYRRDDLARKLRSAIEQARQQRPPGLPDAQPAADPPALEPGGTVLFVEDDALVRLSAVDFLTQAGFAVVEAGNGETALKELVARPDIGILLTDLGLPGMPGAELIRLARDARPGLRVAVLTGRSRDALHREAAIPDDVVCLEKPYDLEALRRTLSALQARSP